MRQGPASGSGAAWAILTRYTPYRLVGLPDRAVKMAAPLPSWMCRSSVVVSLCALCPRATATSLPGRAGALERLVSRIGAGAGVAAAAAAAARMAWSIAALSASRPPW